MRTNLITLICLILISCGGSSDPTTESTESAYVPTPISNNCSVDSRLAGDWQNLNANETLTLTTGCKAYSDTCESWSDVFSQTALSTQGAITITVVSNNGGSDCLPLGTYQCAYAFYDNNGHQGLSWQCLGYPAQHYIQY